MAKKSYMTSDELIDSVKRRSMMPIHQSTFTNADLLAFGDEEMSMGVVPDILKNHEDYLLYTERIKLNQNQRTYSIPYRAIGNRLKDVSILDKSGNYFELTRISIGDLPFFNYDSLPTPRAFYVENNQIILVGNSVLAYDGYVVMSYYMRPNSLVMLDQVAVIKGIDRTTGTLQLTNIPEDFNPGQLYDFISIKSPNKTLKMDTTVLSFDILNVQVTLDPANIPSDLNVGDHLCIAETTAIPQIPSDLHVYLAQRIASRCLEAIGDLEGLQAANAKVAELANKTNLLIANRVEDSPKKINNRNGPLSKGRFFRKRRF